MTLTNFAITILLDAVIILLAVKTSFFTRVLQIIIANKSHFIMAFIILAPIIMVLYVVLTFLFPWDNFCWIANSETIASKPVIEYSFSAAFRESIVWFILQKFF